ncbi:hypothetical protein EW145_g5413 [Phellinidium pouzarii]|uniref:Uncharacterized protein n=1 Tax=Phellinidium pouzarii TaxID=167371 RepID=A0A4S4L008_9AGAM|nr:hypothetical protein EW145_g5413 [Phellinidium pouzarii]
MFFSAFNPNSNAHPLSHLGVGIGAGGTTSDVVVQGLFQGVLLQYVFAEYSLFAPALALALAGRAFLDFFYSQYTDVQKLSFTGMSAIVGFVGSYLLTIVMEEWFGWNTEEIVESVVHHRAPHRKDRMSARETRRDRTRARLREINARERERSRSHSQDRQDRSRHRERDMSAPATERFGAPPTAITEMTSSTLTMEQMGYTGLGRLLDLELANLRKRAATAEADRRRCKEERKWAIAEGDKVRATQLGWQVKRYAAMAESYTREADRRIIEGLINIQELFIFLLTLVSSDLLNQQPVQTTQAKYLLHLLRKAIHGNTEKIESIMDTITKMR